MKDTSSHKNHGSFGDNPSCETKSTNCLLINGPLSMEEVDEIPAELRPWFKEYYSEGNGILKGIDTLWPDEPKNSKYKEAWKESQFPGEIFCRAQKGEVSEREVAFISYLSWLGKLEHNDFDTICSFNPA